MPMRARGDGEAALARRHAGADAVDVAVEPERHRRLADAEAAERVEEDALGRRLAHGGELARLGGQHGVPGARLDEGVEEEREGVDGHEVVQDVRRRPGWR